MGKAGDEVQALRQLAQDYRSVVDNLKGRGWIEEEQQPQQGLVTSTELAPPESDDRYIAINFDLRTATHGEAAKNTVTVQLVAKTPDDNRIKIFKAADLARLGRQKALESFCATVTDYAGELEK